MLDTLKRITFQQGKPGTPNPIVGRIDGSKVVLVSRRSTLKPEPGEEWDCEVPHNDPLMRYVFAIPVRRVEYTQILLGSGMVNLRSGSKILETKPLEQRIEATAERLMVHTVNPFSQEVMETKTYQHPVLPERIPSSLRSAPEAQVFVQQAQYLCDLIGDLFRNPQKLERVLGSIPPMPIPEHINEMPAMTVKLVAWRKGLTPLQRFVLDGSKNDCPHHGRGKPCPDWKIWAKDNSGRIGYHKSLFS